MLMFILISAFALSSLSLLTMILYRLWELQTKRIDEPERAKMASHAAVFFLVNDLKHAEKAILNGFSEGKDAFHELALRAEKALASGNFMKRIALMHEKNAETMKKSPSSSFFKIMMEHRERIRKEKNKKEVTSESEKEQF